LEVPRRCKGTLPRSGYRGLGCLGGVVGCGGELDEFETDWVRLGEEAAGDGGDDRESIWSNVNEVE